jgi:hypothetical protein
MVGVVDAGVRWVPGHLMGEHAAIFSVWRASLAVSALSVYMMSGPGAVKAHRCMHPNLLKLQLHGTSLLHSNTPLPHVGLGNCSPDAACCPVLAAMVVLAAFHRSRLPVAGCLLLCHAFTHCILLVLLP